VRRGGLGMYSRVAGRSVRTIFFIFLAFAQNRLSRIMYEIRHNGIPRSYRDLQATAYEAARLGKARAPGDVVEIVDIASGAKLVMHADGRTG
jgi:hypothetical protein